MYRRVIEEMNDLQETRLMQVTRNERNELVVGNQLAGGQSGLYWIYTSYSRDELATARSGPPPKSVSISETVNQHADLANICPRRVDVFWLVYNGIGGPSPNSARRDYGLRERIGQEFRGNPSTGSLAIAQTSVSDLARWRFSFVLWDEIGLNPRPDYNRRQAERIERFWRHHYGWPILCNK
jgi:hypothetical protein